MCGEYKKESEDFCKKCINHRELAQKASDSDYMIKCFSNRYDEEFNFYVSILGIGYYI
ncbi:hypothetical protein [Methanobrevibacter filiformis]|uniref:Uncharacterized protein n=1 Tax=Methanobrevibacter filiformis TaxID=55758 RepID=A0A166FFN3_9EURY|nr:hypothetical protein [Methanobrevibacter filiformis]KZX17628.1 hypothetical protein MBFIL_00380 [Methanobrevibacter filiformis]